MTDEKTIKLVREGRYIAEVEVTLITDDHEWSPYLAAADVRKLDTVRRHLRAGNHKDASRDAKVFELTPVAAE